jgi:hypothetical protein
LKGYYLRPVAVEGDLERVQQSLGRPDTISGVLVTEAVG